MKSRLPIITFKTLKFKRCMGLFRLLFLSLLFYSLNSCNQVSSNKEAGSNKVDTFVKEIPSAKQTSSYRSLKENIESKVGCIPSKTVSTVCRSGFGWVLLLMIGNN